ncbi:MAG TPA: hypothetical protein PLH24_06790, partial [Candidatus Atribacteria bacterium]|nr:hypothetical protein [Candidatus Atribacteria bacterium]
ISISGKDETVIAGLHTTHPGRDNGIPQKTCYLTLFLLFSPFRGEGQDESGFHPFITPFEKQQA